MFILLLLAVAILVLVQSGDDFGRAFESVQTQRVIDERNRLQPFRPIPIVLRREFQTSRHGVVFTGYKMTLAQSRCASKNGAIDLARPPTNWCSWALVNPETLWPHLRKCHTHRKTGWIDPDLCREGIVSVQGRGRDLSFGEFTGANSWMRFAVAVFLKNLIFIAIYAIIIGALSLLVLFLLHAIYGELLARDD